MEQKEVRLNIRINKNLLAEIDKQASERGLTRSQYVRNTFDAQKK
jgi:predicted DNA binding CopG/RHH family protein